MNKYQNKAVSPEEASKIIESENWSMFCENGHGACYYNYVTGEIIWLGDEECNANLKVVDKCCESVEAHAKKAQEAKIARLKRKTKTTNKN